MVSCKKSCGFQRSLFLLCVLLLMLNVYLSVFGNTRGGGRNLRTSHKLRMSEINDLKIAPEAASRQTSVISSSANDVIMNLCPPTPPNLVGALVVDMEPVSFEEIERHHPTMTPGGRFQPLDCKSRHRVAIVVPYRDREQHLKVLLNNLHPILERQQLDYAIYVVEMDRRRNSSSSHSRERSQIEPP
ncbi:beta-1,4-N-acetylgalactosaminyltransferase bre-4-like [Haliotis rubra]|uniref:beta-1,4-N-acetylgalactosaminyltransferase bre-4-like n=1 Tax=Haliotis rubra TaxID=36100 RepID=UPI001EE5FF7D|nr:beta-1,4-N-acetylgalactosaminyltransferase bre-4-like [Haliotis rubra]